MGDSGIRNRSIAINSKNLTEELTLSPCFFKSAISNKKGHPSIVGQPFLIKFKSSKSIIPSNSPASDEKDKRLLFCPASLLVQVWKPVFFGAAPE